MKKIIALLSLFIVTGYCNAQYRIQKAQAFFTVSTPGMQMTDEKGNKINPEQIIDRFIYVECKYNGKPTIDTVWYNGILYNATVAATEESVLKIGVKKNSGTPVTLSVKKGNHIWRVDVGQATGKTLPHDLVRKILIKGKLDKVKFSYTITTETELSTPDRY